MSIVGFNFENYVLLSSKYPSRIHITESLSKTQAEIIQEMCESQFDYCRHAVSIMNETVYFFESVDDAEGFNMLLNGDYKLKEFK